MRRFPDGFLWGVGTSGGFAGESGDTGQVACDHYRRRREDVDLLTELGVNAYRWDLPQGLEDRGGWLARETAERFAGYAATCFDAYGDRVRRWVTINEPWIVGLLGYQLGLHAPGTDDLRAAVTATHHLLLAHGLAACACPPTAKTGVAFALAPHYPASEDDADREAARGSDGYYFRRVMRAAPGREPFGWEVVVPGDAALTEAGTEITPQAFTDLLVRLRDDYGPVPILVTENGAVFGDALHDARRISYIHDHLEAVHEAIEQGVPVIGYCHWSFMDNFEWALGYTQRFGLVHVDHETLERTVKDSGRYYAGIARANALVAPEVLA